MNWSEMQVDWEHMRLLLKSYWPKLDDKDLEEIQGNRERLTAALELRYALEREDAERAICQFEKEVRFPGAVK